MRRGRDDRGAAEALGIVLMTPVMVGLALVVVLIGRDVDLRAEVGAVAAAAATVAAKQRSVVHAVDLATEVVDGLLAESAICTRHRIEIDTHRFAPGGSVTVTIDCTLSTIGLDGIVDADRVVRASASAAIDPYRSHS